MSLHLVGETIDAKQAHQRAGAGNLLQLIRGVYVDRNDAVDETILAHAVRIARYLYPKAYLSSASSVLLAPTVDGRLFISGRRNQRTRLRSLEIVQNEAPSRPSTMSAIVGDDQGEFHIAISSPRQRFLEAFRLRSEHAVAIHSEMRAQMADRLLEEYGSAKAAADALWTLARENGWRREAEQAEGFLNALRSSIRTPVNKAALDFVVAWHRDPIGRLTHDGSEWRWTAGRAKGPALIRQTTPGKLPAFLESLLPEGWLATVLKEGDEREKLRRGRRYLSNVTIVEYGQNTSALPEDILGPSLERFASKGRFTGTYGGPSQSSVDKTFDANLAQLFKNARTPRLSGVQIKAPMSLTNEGMLLPADERPFTHILKPAGTGSFQALPIVEWLCLELGRAAGFAVPSFALIKMPGALPPALVVERFDIRQKLGDRRRFALEDFCSVLDVPASAKYDGTIEKMARALRPLSTDPDADIDTLFRRAVFAWLIADGDMHLKNVALLKIADPGAKSFSSVRLAPLYDPVTTRAFPEFKGDRMALKLAGKDDRLGRRDFLQLARTMGLPVADAEAALAQLAIRLNRQAPKLRLPEFALRFDYAKAMQEKVRELVVARSAPLMDE